MAVVVGVILGLVVLGGVVVAAVLAGWTEEKDREVQIHG